MPFLVAHGAEGAHVVQTVGKLDEDDPDVLGHGDEQFAEVLALPIPPGLELDFFQF